MRANEFITEAKVITIDDMATEPGNKFRVWMNPTLSDLKQLTQRYTLRGLTWDKLMIVWDGYEAIHNDMDKYFRDHGMLDNIGKTSVSLVLSDADNIEDSFDEWHGEIEEINGIYFMVDYGDPNRMPSFRRSLGIKR